MVHKRILIAIGIVILIALFFPIIPRIGYAVIHGGILQLMGYPVDIPPWELAEQIVKDGKDPSFCFKLQQSIPVGGPTIESRRTNCVYEYAKITKDPNACELLMPSEYGLSCINDVISQEYKDYPDSGFFDYSECSGVQKDALRQDWCNFVTAHRSHKTSDCDPIHNEVIKKGCILKFQMWEKYPELRGSFYFGK